MKTLKVYLAVVAMVLALLAVCFNLSKNAPANTLESKKVESQYPAALKLNNYNSGSLTFKYNTFKYADLY